MKRLVQHLMSANRAEIVEKSLLNCHVKGLHSIMLLECPSKTIRLYITDREHELHKNYNNPDSLSFHPHHCSLSLHSVYGEFTNIIMRICNDYESNECRVYDRWMYNSKISTGTELGFAKDGQDYMQEISRTIVKAGSIVDCQHMNASAIHTVACPEKTVNAWMVYEGKEWDGYKPHAWSNSDLSNIDTTGLYIKPDYQKIYSLLNSVNLM